MTRQMFTTIQTVGENLCGLWYHVVPCMHDLWLRLCVKWSGCAQCMDMMIATYRAYILKHMA